MRRYSRRPVLDTSTPPVVGRVGQVDALRGAAAVPQGVAPPFGPAADAPQPPAGHLGNLFRNMVRGPPPAPPPVPFPPVQPQQFAAGGPPPPHYQWGPGFAHQPMGPPHYVPHPPPQLQPAPVFQGFYGPGGVWQPWGDRRLVEGAALQQRPAQQQPQQDASHSPARATAAPTASEEREQSAPQRVPSEGEPPSSQVPGAPSTPREAAALAAVRRLSPSTPSTQNQESSNSLSQPHQATSASTMAPGPSSPPTQATGHTPISSDPPRSTSTAPQQPTTATSTPNRNLNVPSLIPMSFSPGGTGPRHANAPLPNPSIVYRTAPLRHAPPARPLATLPPTLTDAQLAHLDVLTREAIDERLRVLEAISSTMYRCVEELTRLRSVLPVSTGPTPLATHARSQPGQGQQGSTTQTVVNENDNAPDLRPHDSDVKLDESSSNTKPGADVNGASSSSVGRSDEANGDTTAPAS